MLKGFSATKAVSYLRNCILLETKMNETLKLWTSDMDVSEILVQMPWLDDISAALSMIEPNLREIFSLAEEFISLSKNLNDPKSATPKVQVELYFESPTTAYMQKVMDTGVQISNNEFMTWRGRFEKAHLTLRNYIKVAFDIEDYFEGEKDRIFETYEAQYGSLEAYFKELLDYCSTHPLFLSKVVEENSELFKKLFAEHTEINKEEFDVVSEAVMPWDIVMFKRNELPFDKAYMARLEKRIEDSSSIYNDMPIITEVMDKLPDELCKDLYKYEFLISVSSIEYIKEGTLTFAEVLKDCESVSQTSYF